MRIKSRFKDWRRRKLLERHGIGVQIDVPTFSAGARSGTWVVCDGGLGPESPIYSFGVGDNIAWELAMIERFGVTVHAFDPTPEAIGFVESQRLPGELVFHRMGLGAHDGAARFKAPRRAGKVNYQPERPGLPARADGEWIECEVRRLPTLMEELGHDRLEVLKIDIEGGEYDTVDDVLSVAPDQLLIEFHHNMPGIAFEKTLDVLSRLGDAGYRVFDISRRGLEFSLLGPSAATPAS